MLTATQQVLLVAGNVIAVFGGGALFVRWLRGWLVKQVAQPVNELQHTVEEIKTDLADVDSRAREAHKRIDQLMLGRAYNA